MLVIPSGTTFSPPTRLAAACCAQAAGRSGFTMGGVPHSMRTSAVRSCAAAIPLAMRAVRAGTFRRGPYCLPCVASAGVCAAASAGSAGMAATGDGDGLALSSSDCTEPVVIG